MTPTGDQQSQPQDPGPQRERRIMRRTRVERRGTSGGIGDEREEREAKKYKNSPKSYRDEVRNGGQLGGRNKERRRENVR